MKVFKYQLNSWPSTYMLPKGAQFLSVQTQHEEPQMWFLVDPEAKLEPRRFVGVPTGKAFDVEGLKQFCGTFQLSGGSFVFHVFEFEVETRR